MEKLFESVALKVKNVLESSSCGHDYYHAKRVFDTALYIADKEGQGKRDVIGVAALVHDICRPWEKETGLSHFSEEALAIIHGHLVQIGIEGSVLTGVIDLVRYHDIYDQTRIPNLSIELQILQDADRLDAMGALGIARTFAFGGANGFTMYEPGENLIFTQPFVEDPSHRTTTIAHFYEKLLKLRDGLHTETGKALGQIRHIRMERFLEDFFTEWNSEDKII